MISNGLNLRGSNVSNGLNPHFVILEGLSDEPVFWLVSTNEFFIRSEQGQLVPVSLSDLKLVPLDEHDTEFTDEFTNEFF